MGLFAAILTAPLQPVRGVAWVAQQLLAEADRMIAEQQDPRRLLTDLARARDEGRLSDAEFEIAEEQLLRRLTSDSTIVLRHPTPDEEDLP